MEGIVYFMIQNEKMLDVAFGILFSLSIHVTRKYGASLDIFTLFKSLLLFAAGFHVYVVNDGCFGPGAVIVLISFTVLVVIDFAAHFIKRP